MHETTLLFILHRHHSPFSSINNNTASPPLQLKNTQIIMAQHLRDEYGNPIELKDELGNPVELTDERGNPVHITGIATKEEPTIETIITTDVPETGLLASTTVTAAGTGTDADPLKGDVVAPVGAEHGGIGGGGAGDVIKDEKGDAGEITWSSSSSSGSSEDDGQGERRKKKGLKQKLKEKLTGGNKHKEEHGQTVSAPTTTTTTTPTGELHHEHEKKSVLEKIKDKLPGHHRSH